MNKQELIERLNDFKVPFGDESEYVKIDTAIKLASELDEPQKVQVPQFVADWINKAKGWGKTLYYALDHSPEEVNLWFCEDEVNRQNIFARAWLDGYTVEKEKRYLVKLKNINDYLNTTETGFHFYNKWRNNETFTRKELEEANFGWVFDCPGIEIEEVEE